MNRLACAAATVVFAALSVAFLAAGNPAAPLQIGMAKSFFRDQSSGVVNIVAGDFKDVMKQTTGLVGKLVTTFSAAEIAEKLESKQLAFGIFFAHEFAWMQKKYPDLRPLMIAANKRHEERAYILVHKTNPAKSIADLRGAKFDLPKRTIEPCRLYVERNCTDKDHKGPAAFFSTIQQSPSSEEALNDVARGAVQAAVVNTAELVYYKEIRSPVYEKHLRILQVSNVFPSALLAYKPGALTEATLKQFRDGLLRAHTVKSGREMMKEWNVDAFELVPKDYANSLADLLKRYPAAK